MERAYRELPSRGVHFPFPHLGESIRVTGGERLSPATQKLPDYLKKFISVQNYDAYSSRDHAAWRFIMRQNQAFFSKYAAPIYLEGLKKTGIPIDRIPRISEMDQCLAQFGWGAVAVKGFIPPAAFLDFQARSVLPIASDMRTVDHIAYTPAPDIVHEAAGHAPILADPSYAQYLTRYARLARNAIFSVQDIRTYEVIRYLSDIKENPDTTPEEITRAEARLKEVTSEPHELSENAQVTRMNWWTVEYGLVGSLKEPKIYGAGLLSSVGESQTCLSDRVAKIPLTLDCIHTAYDITEPQPQLFVTPTMEHLIPVLEELESTMSYVLGGIPGLARAKTAGTVTTVCLDSGMQVSGVLQAFSEDTSELSYLQWAGRVQLANEDQQLHGHGPERHSQGYGTPVGRWKRSPDRDPATFSDSELTAFGLVSGKQGELDFASGVRVKGRLKATLRKHGKLVLLTWSDVTVTRGAEVLFQPAWGEFDMAVGTRAVSVRGGPADAAPYGEFDIGHAETTPGRKSPYSDAELALFGSYQWIREARSDIAKLDTKTLDALAQSLIEQDSDEWLLAVEIFELTNLLKIQPTWDRALRRHLGKISHRKDPSASQWIAKGLALASH